MSESASKAVFLSYASQDAATVWRICEALRAAGIEVWFDQNELVGGDAWDQKIRGQVRSCALFVPIISAATQARLEGYFRLEWKLAAQRTHTMADAKPFLLPVVIDATHDADAHVPEEFRAVQWTKLPGGEAPEKFCARVSQLLGGGAAPQPGRETPDRGPMPRATPQRSSWIIPGVIAAALVIALALWQPWKKSPVAPSPTAAPAPAVAASKPGAETAADFAEQARNRYYPFATPANLQLADELSRRATELDPQNARAWGTRANASARYLLRAFVSGEAAQQRARDAQSFANRALSLDKNETEALVALGIVATHQHASTQAETIFRRVLAVDPNNVQAPSLLSIVFRDTGRGAEALPLMKRAVANAPRDPILHLFLGFAYWSGWNFTRAAEQFDIAATVADFQNARVYQAWVVFLQTGDLARLRTMLESVDLVYSADDSKLTYLLACGLFERRADRVIEAAGRTASAYFDAVAMPKAWFSALAYESDHKDNLARQQWLAAEAVIRERLRADPQSEMLRMNLAITLAKLGRTPEARTEFDAVEGAWREQLNAGHALWLARFHTAVGDAPRAVALLRQSVNRLGNDAESFQNTTSRTIQFDPWWDPIRNTAEFRELLAHPPDPPTPVDDEPATKLSAAEIKTDEKSVAVLAFANLSDDKANEYFSDGISEELLNVLGRVPGLRVAAPLSAFSFKGKNVSAQEIGQKLNVAYLVNGSVRRVGPAIRVVARLTRADTDEQIWTEKFDGEAKNVFALQDEIAGKIAAALSLKLGASARVAKPIDPEAYRLYLEGRHLWSLRNLDALDRAEALFQQALRIEPESALIHAGLAELYATRALYRAMSVLPEAGDLGRATEQADRAIALDPKLSQGYVARATIALARQDSAGAERLLRDSLALAPNDALALNRLGDAMINAGRLDTALEYYQRALQLDPLSVFMVRDVVRELTYAHRFQEATEVQQRFDAATSQDTRFAVGDFYAQMQLGMMERARAKLIARLPTFTPETFPGPGIVEWVFNLREAKLEAESEALAKQLLSHYGPDTYIHAMVLMARGRTEEALPLLKPFPPGSQDRLYWSPMFDLVREDPRFLRKVEELGVVAEYKVARETLARMLKEQAAKK